MDDQSSPFADGYDPFQAADTGIHGTEQNPYRTPPDEAPFVAQLVPHQPVLRPPRVWSSLLVAFLVIPVAAFVAGAVLIGVAVADAGPNVLSDPQTIQNWLGDFASTKLGLIVLVLPGQVVFFSVAVLGGLISPERWTKRLGLRRGSLPLWCWGLFALATPMIGLASSVLLSGFVDEMSDQLKMMEEMMRSHADHFLVGLLCLVAVVPGVVEELLFRGYLQSRLTRRWHPFWAILFSATIFSCAHLDPVHVLGVLPLGIWLGLVAWRSASVLPAMLCHIANNAVAVIGTKYQENQTLELTMDSLTVGTLAVCVPALLASLAIIFFWRE